MHERTLIILNEQQWKAVEKASRQLPPGHAILDFWREALGLTQKQWDELPPSAFNVSDFQVTPEDDLRLREILNIKSLRRMDRSRVEWILLDRGPGVAIPEGGVTP